MGKVVPITMTDVARRAGVCQATVSLALRHHPSIPAATRERVEQAAEALGYRKNAPISTLMACVRARKQMEPTTALAAVTGWPTRQWFAESDFYQGLMRGAVDRARELGYKLEEFWLNEPGLSERRLSQILVARGIEGAVVFPVPEHPHVDLEWDKFAGSTIGYTLIEPALPRVSVAHYDAVTIALSQLSCRGYRRIGLAVDAVINERVQRHWLAAFCAYQFDPQAFDPGSVLLSQGNDIEQFGAWLRSYRPDAIIVGGLFEIRPWLSQLGLEAPGDVGLVGLSNRYAQSGCAYIDERPDAVGAVAVEIVVDQIRRNEQGIPAQHRDVLISGAWGDGPTVRALPSMPAGPVQPRATA
jgi:LacI family transcriptional regulator